EASDVWALYRLEMESYEGLTDEQKKELLTVIASFAYGVESDFTLLRVSRRWSVEDYLARARAGLDRRHGLPEQWDRQLDGHRELLGDQSIVRPELYLSVRLAEPRKGALDALAASVGEAIAHPLRLFESPIYKGYRHLEIHSELGVSHQALYTLGALPETVSFPGPQAELLFAPLESLEFPVDAVFSARYVPNSQATALVRRK